MIALVGSVLAASLLGSPHCAGMCGGFVCFFAGDAQARGRLRAHVAYNAGRLVSYLALGGVAGWLGAGVDHVGAIAGIGRAAAILAGVLMIAWGAMRLMAATGHRILPASAPPWQRPLTRALGRVRAWPPVARAATLGLLTTLIPCGFLYAFAVIAAGAGTPLGGALVMAAFWLGTVPVMASLGLIAQRALGPLRARVPVFTAVVLMVLGFLTLTGRLAPGTGAHAGVHGAHCEAHLGAR